MRTSRHEDDDLYERCLCEFVGCDDAETTLIRLDRPVDKRRTSRPLSQGGLQVASLLRQPRLAQAFAHAHAAREIDGIVADLRLCPA